MQIVVTFGWSSLRLWVSIATCHLRSSLHEPTCSLRLTSCAPRKPSQIWKVLCLCGNLCGSNHCSVSISGGCDSRCSPPLKSGMSWGRCDVVVICVSQNSYHNRSRIRHKQTRRESKGRVNVQPHWHVSNKISPHKWVTSFLNFHASKAGCYIRLRYWKSILLKTHLDRKR